MRKHEHTDRLAALIPWGRENAISRKALAEKLGKTREAIEDARRDGLIIINTQDGGYFQTDDTDEMLCQYRQDTARALSILRRRKPLRKALIAAGVKLKS